MSKILETKFEVVITEGVKDNRNVWYVQRTGGSRYFCTRLNEIGNIISRLWEEYEKIKKNHMIVTELQGPDMEWNKQQAWEKFYPAIHDRGKYTILDIEKKSGLSREVVLYYLRYFLESDFMGYCYQNEQLYFTWTAVREDAGN